MDAFLDAFVACLRGKSESSFRNFLLFSGPSVLEHQPVRHGQRGCGQPEPIRVDQGGRREPQPVFNLQQEPGKGSKPFQHLRPTGT